MSPVFPPLVNPPTALFTRLPPVQQTRIPPSTQVVIRAPLRPRLFNSARTTMPTASSRVSTPTPMPKP